jgi:hypothetical protein
MSRIDYRDGSATVTLTGDLRAWAERAIADAAGAADSAVTAALETVAADAERQWYGQQGVRRVTGLSGQMEVVRTIDVGRGVLRWSVGSMDRRRAGKSGATVPAFVHRAGGLATTPKAVTRAEYDAAPPSTRRGRARKAWPDSDIKQGDWVILIASPRRGDGAKLLPIFVYAPARAAIQSLVPRLAVAMAARMGRAHG